MTHFAWVFPGQGSQKVGMLQGLIEKFPVVKQTFIDASKIIDFDLLNCVQNGPESELNSTHITQPALLAASVAMWRVWQQEGGKPASIMSGHSLGEYSALVCSNAISFDDAINLVHQRGLFMQQAVNEDEGLMAAIIGLSLEQVNKLCEKSSSKGIVQPANINSPQQIVLAGSKDAVLEAIKEAKNVGAKRAIALQVSVPSHCSLMRPAADKLQKILEGIKVNSPMIPVLHNVDANIRKHPDDIKLALCEQLYKPVQWVECINTIANDGIHDFIEAGPGKVLAGLIKRIDSESNVYNIEDLDIFSQALIKN
jgi:[acyl-carrier-protein] S-malonyltransferase